MAHPANEQAALAELAMEWVATLDDQPDDPVIRRRFTTWLNADPAHQAAFLVAEQAWAAALENGEAVRPRRRRWPNWVLPAVVAVAILLGLAVTLAA